MSGEFYTNVLVQGNNILEIGYNIETGKRFKRIEHFKPSVYVPSDKGSDIGQDGRQLKQKKLDLKEFYIYLQENNFKIPIYGNIQPQYQYIAENYGLLEYQLDLIKVCYIDIEVECYEGFPNVNLAEDKITAITVKDAKKNKFYTLGLKDFDKNKCQLEGIDNVDVEYRKCVDEKEMLSVFIQLINILKPDVLSGWNIEFFDIPYLSNRILCLLGSEAVKKITITNNLMRKEKSINNQTIIYNDWNIPIIDYIALYKKFVYEKLESYALDFVANKEVQKSKKEKQSDLTDLFEKNHQKFIEYNIWDTELVHLINKKKKLLELCFTIAYLCKIQFKDVFSPVKSWDVLIYNRLKEKNLQIIPNKDSRKIDYPGAYVKNVRPGKYKYIVFFDLNSLYPNIIIGFNISKESLRSIPNDIHKYINDNYVNGNDYDINTVLSFQYENIIQSMLSNNIPTEMLADHNLILTPNLECWSKEKQGTLGEIMEDLYNKRVLIKKDLKSKKINKDVGKVETLDLMQNALKTLMNSGYGAFANDYFRYFDVRVASAITLTGQFIIRYIEKKLIERMSDVLDVIYSDTDSVALSFEKYVNKNAIGGDVISAVEKYAKTVVYTEIKNILNEIFIKSNMFKNTLEMKLEIVGDAGIWTAKKKYFVRKQIDDGIRLDPPSVKYTGLELVRSSTPKIIRDKLKEVVPFFLDLSMFELGNIIRSYYKEFCKFDICDIAFPRGISDVVKYDSGDEKHPYIKGTPIHVRAALLYNQLLHKYNIRNHKPIRSGEKMKFIYLKPNNPSNENIIGFVDDLPVEFGLHAYIDYEKQFDKAFMRPLELISTACNWSIKEQVEHPRVDLSKFKKVINIFQK